MAKDLRITFLLDFYGDMLTEKQREVIVLHFWEELSLREIAKKKGVHHSSVEETFTAAMKKLEKFFKKT